MFRYALWLSLTITISMAGHFWTIELLHHLLWSKAIQFHLSWNMWMEKDASKSTPNWTTAYPLCLKHLQFCAFIHRLLSLLGAKHFERRKCGHPDVCENFERKLVWLLTPKKNTKAFGPMFSKMWQEKLWRIDFDLPPSDDVHLNTPGTSRWRKSKKSR